jgi:hypothetical protein
LGHKDVSTTEIYTHVLNRGPFAVMSPLDETIESRQSRAQHVWPQSPARPRIIQQSFRSVSLRPIARASDKLLGDTSASENDRRRDDRNR